MKKRSSCLLILANIYLRGVFWNSVRVEAAPRPLTDLGYFQLGKPISKHQQKIPSSCIMEKNTTVEALEGDVGSDYIIG